jgi:DNA polymerase III subunit delta'
LNSIIGQKKLKQQLLSSVHQTRISHAYLFSGASGIGKKTIACAFAKMILCMEPNEEGACGCCQSCLLINNLSNPDLVTIEAEEGKSEIAVSSARTIKDDAYIKPLICKRKVYIIVDSEKMNVYAQNCILKILEEPNQYVTIILTSANPEMLMDTIRSRVIEYNMERYTADEIETYLRDNVLDIQGDIHFIINASEGIIGKAVKIAISPELQNLRENLLSLLFHLKKSEDEELRQLYKENKDNINFLLNIMSTFYRDVLVYKNTCDEKLLINSDKKDMIKKSAKEHSVLYLMNNIDIIEKVNRDIDYNTNYNNTIDYMLVNLQEEIDAKCSRSKV